MVVRVLVRMGTAGAQATTSHPTCCQAKPTGCSKSRRSSAARREELPNSSGTLGQRDCWQTFYGRSQNGRRGSGRECRSAIPPLSKRTAFDIRFDQIADKLMDAGAGTGFLYFVGRVDGVR
jgi:hypothetical protein